MNPQDFNGIYKWKFLVPIVYIINWSLIVVGPLFFPYAYQIMCMIIITYSVLKTWGLCLGTFVSLIKFKYSMKMLQVCHFSILVSIRHIASALIIVFACDCTTQLQGRWNSTVRHAQHFSQKPKSQKTVYDILGNGSTRVKIRCESKTYHRPSQR